MTTQIGKPNVFAQQVARAVCPETVAERLYLSYVNKADEVARRLCFHFKCSGASAFDDEARSVARIALWKCAVRYDPQKQKLERMKMQRQQEKKIDAIMWGYAQAECERYDPYRNFWMASAQRIGGAVIDLFRAERLITKPPKGQTTETMVPTMLYQERFLSMDRRISEVSSRSSGGGSHDTFGDMIPSADRADKNDDIRDMRALLAEMKDAAGLTAQEREALDLFYSDEGFNKSEVAALMGISSSMVTGLLAKAIEKLRETKLQPA